MLSEFALGFLLSSAMGVGGYYKAALSKSGVLGAILVGTAIFGVGGWQWGVVLVIFFVSASTLSSFKRRQKKSISEKFEKGSRRDLGQALANGGVAAVAALATLVAPDSSIIWLAFLGAMATVNADTWATELGILSKVPPRLITNGKVVPAGTSGGMTLVGTLAALAGSLLIGVAGWLFAGDMPKPGAAMIMIVGFAGLAGAMFDSLLGATYQVMYLCQICGQQTEKVTCCHQETAQIQGYTWLNNDWVNFLSAVVGAVIAALLARLLS